MKGQYTIEFIISLGLFIILIVFLMNYSFNVLKNYRSEYTTNLLNLKALQISDMILYDPGKWNEGKCTLMGLAYESGGKVQYHEINSSKINDLSAMCTRLGDINDNGFKDLMDCLKVGPYNLSISVAETDGNSANCDPSVTHPVFYSSIKPHFGAGEVTRIALTNNKNVVKIVVKVWQQ